MIEGWFERISKYLIYLCNKKNIPLVLNSDSKKKIKKEI